MGDARVVASGSVILLLALIGLFAPLISPYDPEFMDTSLSLAAPGAGHWLGTDQLGRDVLTRLIYGARLSLQISVYAVAFAFIVGVTVGVVSSYFGSWVDTILMRVVDVLLAFPALVLAITVAAYLGPSLKNIVLVIGIVYTPVFARLTYVVTRAVKPVEYVQAARALGASHGRIIFRAILPNSLAPLIVQISLSLGFAILTESGLSFLGVGVPPPAPSWGSEIAQARLTLNQAPLLVVWPSLVIACAILSFNILGDALRDLLDPRIRTR
jgi:peptide/nickel transport system permease protein